MVVFKTNSWIKTDVPVATAISPLNIVTSKTNVLFLSGDLGITIGTGVSAWADQSGNAANASQGTAGFQPSYNAAGLNNKGTVLFDGSDDYLNFATFTRPAPGTTPSWYWIVFKQVTWQISDSVFGSATTQNRLQFATSTPNLSIRSSAASGPLNSGATVGSWVRGEALFNNSTTDYLKLANTSVTGTNVGSTAITAGGFNLASQSGAAGWSNIEVAAFACWNGEPNSEEKTLLNAWVTAYYGSSVLV